MSGFTANSGRHFVGKCPPAETDTLIPSFLRSNPKTPEAPPPPIPPTSTKPSCSKSRTTPQWKWRRKEEF